MSKVSFDRLVEYSGQEVAVSAWLQVPQTLINTFAELTGDKNLIHLTLESAQSAGFEKPIVHGYLLIALIPQLLEQCFEFPQKGVLINRDLRWKFQGPVLSEDSIRLRVKVLNGRNLRGMITIKVGLTMEVLSNVTVGKGTATFVCLTSSKGG